MNHSKKNVAEKRHLGLPHTENWKVDLEEFPKIHRGNDQREGGQPGNHRSQGSRRPQNCVSAWSGTTRMKYHS